jgi:hypothetical protein
MNSAFIEPGPPPEAGDADSVLLELIALYREQNDGKEPTDDDVKQWIETLRQATEEATTALAPSVWAGEPRQPGLRSLT